MGRFKDLYQSKLVSINESLQHIQSNDHVVTATAACEPQGLLSQLHTISNRVENVTVTTCLPMTSFDYFSKDEYKKHFNMEGWFYMPVMRKNHSEQRVSYIPHHLRFAGLRRLDHRPVNVFVGSASPMDKYGYLSLSLSAIHERDMIERADIVILEVNPKLPRTFGDTTVHVGEVDFIVENEFDLPELPVAEPNEKDERIGKFIAEHVEDGSTIQLGIGAIPNAVSHQLMDKKDLGIHTEMLTDGMVDLFEAGVITGKYKTLYPHKMVASFALGTERLYRFLDDNPGIAILRNSFANDPYVIAQNDNMVSINTTLEVDLTGQCNSESIGHRQYSGTGGQGDTAIGAQMAKGGKSFIALHSTAEVRVPGTDERKTVSKIVPSLRKGSAVTLSRNDVDYVVTEYGVASLRGTSIRERVEKLIAIAHPDFREELRQEAEKEQIW